MTHAALSMDMWLNRSKFIVRNGVFASHGSPKEKSWKCTISDPWEQSHHKLLLPVASQLTEFPKFFYIPKFRGNIV